MSFKIDTVNKTSIFSAIASKDRPSVQAFVHQNNDVQQMDAQQNTPLVWAIAHDDAAMTEYLIQQGASTHTQNINGSTPLMFAAAKGNIQILNILLSEGADTNVVNNMGETALHWAIKNGQVQIIRKLLEYKPPLTLRNYLSDNVFDLAFKMQLFVVEELLFALISLPVEDQRAALKQISVESYYNFIMYAIENKPEILAFLCSILKNIDLFDPTILNYRPGNKLTPLVSAAEKGVLNAVQILIQMGVDINGRDAQGNTALMAAIRVWQPRIAIELLAHYAQVDTENLNGEDPIQLCTKHKLPIIKKAVTVYKNLFALEEYAQRMMNTTNLQSQEEGQKLLNIALSLRRKVSKFILALRNREMDQLTQMRDDFTKDLESFRDFDLINKDIWLPILGNAALAATGFGIFAMLVKHSTGAFMFDPERETYYYNLKNSLIKLRKEADS